MMYSYAESLIQTGFDEGIEKGIEKGIQIGEGRGEMKNLVYAISRLIEHGFSFDDAFDMVAKPGTDRKEVRSRVEAGTNQEPSGRDR